MILGQTRLGVFLRQRLARIFSQGLFVEVGFRV